MVFTHCCLHCVVYNVLFTVCCLLGVVFTVSFTRCCLHYVIYMALFTLCSLHYVVFTVLFTLCCLHCVATLCWFFFVLNAVLTAPAQVIYLDLKKACDKVPHQRLLLKLKAHGIGNGMINWIEKWIIDRRQRVVVDGEVSNWKSVLSAAGISTGTHFILNIYQWFG